METAEIDVGGALGSVKDLILAHWSLLVVAIVLGIIGNFTKSHIWTKERALHGRPKWLWWWGRASLSIHAPLFGGLIGIILILVYGPDVPAGPNVDTNAEIFFYYTFSGVLSSYVYSGFKHFMKSRGIELENIQMPGQTIPPKEPSTPPPAP